MKLYIKTASVILFVSLSLASCSKTEGPMLRPESALQIESVSGISPFALMREPASRAVITGETLPDEDAATGIGIFVTKTDGSAYDKGCTNVNFACNGSSWSTATPIYLSDTQGKLYGYFPYNENADDLRAIPVRSSLNGTDYLYAKAQTVSHKNRSVSLTMSHALSRLHLTVRKGANFTAEAPLSTITLKSTAIDATGTLDLTTGAITAAKKSGETGTVEFATSGTITAEGLVKDILLVPADNSEGKKDVAITLLIDDKPAGITLSGENGLNFRSGIQNNVTLTVEDTGIKVSKVDVEEWYDRVSQQVNMGTCTVTVRLAEEQMSELADDIVFINTPRKEEGKVRIEVLSKAQKRRLECYLSGEASCHAETGSLVNQHEAALVSHIFTISDIATNVTATIGYPRPSGISLNVSSQTVHAGCSFKLKATVSPDDAANKTVIWSSSDPSVATVDANGRVQTKADGIVDITATTEAGGLTATCEATVKPFKPDLPGVFSIGPKDNCRKVHFSRGNLKYTPGIESWWFFDEQYKHGHSQDELSLFTWGYGSWSTVWDTEDHGNGNFTDWGTQVDDGSTWRTLSKGEWDFLIENRTDAAAKVGHATVCGMNGIILLPDEFEDPETNESTVSVDKKFVPESLTGWSQNVYVSGKSWNEMEAAGAVFLPAAGFRYQYQVQNSTDAGAYWSSSLIQEWYGMFFTSDTRIRSISFDIPYVGYSVRLVTECE